MTFVFAYGVNAALYTVITGVSLKILILSALLFPSMIFGILVGTFLSKILDEKTFRFIVLGVLICTICTLGLVLFSVHL